MPPNAVIPVSFGATSIDVIATVEAAGSSLPPIDWEWSGNSAIVVPPGEHHLLRDSVDLTAPAHVRGLLTCTKKLLLDGHGFDIHTHDGALNLQGEEKRAWCRWGDPVNWTIGDRIWVARTAPGIGRGVETIWQGSWATTFRHAGAPDVISPRGTVMRPEVINLSQTVTLKNLKRIMFHEATRVQAQILRWLRVLNSGEAGVFDSYPIHFHMLGDYSRGSLVEGVVVEGGKNHAFVPHSSHGITLKDTAALNTIGSPYWWNEGQLTKDLVLHHNMALGAVAESVSAPNNHVTGFYLQTGEGSLFDCVAAGINGGVGASGGFHWPAFVGSWPSDGLVAHNNGQTGIYVWNNDKKLRTGANWVSYRNLHYGVMFGAYQNPWAITNLESFENQSPPSDAQIETADLIVKAVPFSDSPAPRIIGGRVGTVLQGHHNVQTQSNNLQPTLLIDVEMNSYRVRDATGMWTDLVRCLKGGIDLEPADIVIDPGHNHPSNRWRGQRRDGTAWQKTSNGTVTAIPPFWAAA